MPSAFPSQSSSYSVTVERLFVAQHFLTVPDCGDENQLHSHAFTARFEARGGSLDDNGYLVDIVEFENCVDETVERYRDETLNDLPEIEGNPSAERLASALCDAVAEGLDAPEVDSLAVSVREDERAWVSYERSV